ncbi:RLF2 [Candida jiufengensis]|uniref:RLF2 n=1 Tax=Candida jiufengensis TaxID=497108 RepID=UPI0022249227|nr:RLF2 [Candida jiufengensis]KAI5955160.1 RLF2 [Candida jiufengensis]
MASTSTSTSVQDHKFNNLIQRDHNIMNNNIQGEIIEISSDEINEDNEEIVELPKQEEGDIVEEYFTESKSVSESANTKKRKINDEPSKISKQEERELKKKKIDEKKETKRQRIEREKQEREAKKKAELEEKQRKQAEREIERANKKRQEAEEKEAKRLKLEREKAEREERKRIEQEQKDARKLEEQRKREEREREKAEKKARWEEKERIRIEKKRLVEEEKKAKEEAKRLAEDEKRKAEEAEAKKQKRIVSFFQASPQKRVKESSASSEEESTPSKPKLNDYETTFLPFFVQHNVSLENTKNYSTEKTKEELDSILSGVTKSSIFESSLIDLKPKPTSTTSSITPESILNALNIPTTREYEIHEMILSLSPIRYIRFYENSKPPYIGTWCSQKHNQQQQQIIKNPLNTELTGLDYEYDSDLEWNEGDGEDEDIDLDDDDEEEEIEEDEEDQDFVEQDQAQHQIPKKNLIIINKWNDETNKQFFENFKTIHLVNLDNLKIYN